MSQIFEIQGIHNKHDCLLHKNEFKEKIMSDYWKPILNQAVEEIKQAIINKKKILKFYHPVVNECADDSTFLVKCLENNGYECNYHVSRGYFYNSYYILIVLT